MAYHFTQQSGSWRQFFATTIFYRILYTNNRFFLVSKQSSPVSLRLQVTGRYNICDRRPLHFLDMDDCLLFSNFPTPTRISLDINIGVHDNVRSASLATTFVVFNSY